MTAHTAAGPGIEIVVIGGGYAGVLAANRLTQRNDITVTLINPRTHFVERIRLHQLVAGAGAAVAQYAEVLSQRVELVVDTVVDQQRPPHSQPSHRLGCRISRTATGSPQWSEHRRPGQAPHRRDADQR